MLQLSPEQGIRVFFTMGTPVLVTIFWEGSSPLYNDFLSCPVVSPGHGVSKNHPNETQIAKK